jgi:catechol 2,3-dioxygenase-like lactoylglutathione lyase family enzyme
MIVGPAQATGVVQIGIVVANAELAANRYRTLLGIDGWQVNHLDTAAGVGTVQSAGKPTDVKAKIVWTDLGGVELELIEPQDAGSEYAEFLATRGPGVHHIMLGVADYGQSREHLASNGVQLLLEGQLQNTRFCLFDGSEELGMVLELADGDALEADGEL